jgi:hypothetical protein
MEGPRIHAWAQSLNPFRIIAAACRGFKRQVRFLWLAAVILVAALWLTSEFRYLAMAYGTNRSLVEMAVWHGQFRVLHKVVTRASVRWTGPAWEAHATPSHRGFSVAIEAEGQWPWVFPLQSVSGSMDPKSVRLPGGIAYEEAALCDDVDVPGAASDTEGEVVYRCRHVKWPIAWPAGVAAAGALWTWLAWWRRRPRPGLCPNCGYDWRVQLARQGGKRCPECGADVNPQAPARAGP